MSEEGKKTSEKPSESSNSSQPVPEPHDSLPEPRKPEDTEALKKEFERLNGLEQLLFRNHDQIKARKKYLEAVLDSVQANHGVKEAVKKRIKKCGKKIKNKIKKSTKFMVTANDHIAAPQIDEEKTLRKSFKIEEDIRKAKLKEVKRMKEELELKLATLNENVSILATSPVVKKDKEIVAAKDDRAALEQKRKEALDFIQKLKEEKKERKKKVQERLASVKEKRKKQDEELMKKIKEREEEMLKERKEKTIKTYQQLKQKREEDMKKFVELKSRPSLPPPGEYLYKKLEDQYNKKVLLPMLEDKKRELAKKRNMCKPVSKEEIEEHAHKFELLMAQQEEARELEAKARKKKEEDVLEAIKKFKTPTLERLSLQETKLKEEMEKRKGEKHELREKMENYANLIKDTCPVKVSDTKAQELKKQIEQLKHPVRQARDIRKSYELATLNKRNKKDGSHSADKPSKDRTETVLSSPKLIDKATEPVKSVRHSAKEKNKSGEILRPEPPKVKKLDYLGELRKKREEHYGASKPVRYDWTSDLKNEQLNTAEKYTRLVGKANMIEEQAKMKEKLLQAKGGTEKNPEMGEFVSDMFIDAIKAKLAILENLQVTESI